jgi:outer membrane protein OmpA-like peptidoglycan-associated protein
MTKGDDSMRKNTTRLVLCALTTALMLTLAGTAWGQKINVKGLIVGRNGPDMTIQGQYGNVTITLNDDTKVEEVKGAFGFRHSELGMTALVPGLPVEVQYTQQTGGQLLASTVKFKASDLQTAQQIQAGLAPTDQQLSSTEQQVQANQQKLQAQQQQMQSQEQQIQSNQQQIQSNREREQKTQAEEAALGKRFSELADYNVKGEATVYFATNSTEISAQAQQDLQALAAKAKAINGYLIQVAGYASATGNATYNQMLSSERAAGVIAYLQQSCGVALFRVLAPAAMGSSDPAASNATTEGRAENRRVVIKILVNKGVAGGS